MAKSSEEKERASIEAFKRRLYSRPATPEEQATYGPHDVLGINLPPTELMLSRLRRCQNCHHFDQGEKYRQMVFGSIARDSKLMFMAGKPKSEVDNHMLRLRRALGDGKYGYCLIRDRRKDEAAGADFTHMFSRCEEWSGDVAPDGAKDPDAKEVYDEAGK